MSGFPPTTIADLREIVDELTHLAHEKGYTNAVVNVALWPSSSPNQAWQANFVPMEKVYNPQRTKWIMTPDLGDLLLRLRHHIEALPHVWGEDDVWATIGLGPGGRFL